MRVLALLFPALLSLLLIVGLGAISGFFVMLLWNYLLVGTGSIIGVSLPALTWFKAWMLTILTGILFKPIGGSSSSS
jgi:hypothetical protein